MQRLFFLFLVFAAILYKPLDANADKNMNIYTLRQSLVLGDVPLQVSTTNPEAKAHFLLGAAFLHAFMYDLAILQFQEAQKLDPSFAMSYWGEAMAYKHPLWNDENLAAGQGVLHRYQLNNNPSRLTDKEKGYIHALEILFSNQLLLNRDRDYMNALESLYKQYPNDPDIGAFYALSILGVAADFPNDPDNEKRIQKGRRLINQLFKNFPHHPGIVHYYLHYHDTTDIQLAKEAIPAAQIALKIMSSSSHVTHMAAHIFRRLELWDAYIKADELSIKAADSLCSTLNIQPAYACNAENKYHSMEWLHDGYLKTKQFDKASALVKKVEGIASKDSAIIYKQWYYRMWARQVLLSKNWTLAPIKIQPIAQKDAHLFWSAYSECGALQASSFLAIHHQKPIHEQLNRLKQLIDMTGQLASPYIQQSCHIAQLEIQAEQAKIKGKRLKASYYTQKALGLQERQISTELTPSLPFLSAEQYYQDYIRRIFLG